MSLEVFAPFTLFSDIYFLLCMFGGNDKLNMKQKIIGGLFQRVGHFAGGISYGGFNAGALLTGGHCAGRPFCRVAVLEGSSPLKIYLEAMT